MKLRIEKSFDLDVSKIRDKKLLIQLRNVMYSIEMAKSIFEVTHIKKIQGFKSFYRIKIGDYRLGIEQVSGQEVNLIRFLHRKEIYRYFPHK